VRALVFSLLLLTSCKEPAATVEPASSCETQLFEGSRFTLCSVKGGKVEVRTSGKAGPYRSFASLQAALGQRADKVAFAMNAGMFDESGNAIGLLIEDGKQIHAINRRQGGGNFHLMPNGVFLVRRDGSAAAVESKAFAPSKDISFATQSGPMLMIDGKLHPAFDQDGASKHFRNGVGIGPEGRPVFVISADPVSFGKLARFYRDSLKAKNALFFDGAVSSLWDPAAHRLDSHAPLGPMVVVFRP
jgi:uncharacterized protein YigE (DUF2233 family)